MAPGHTRASPFVFAIECVFKRAAAGEFRAACARPPLHRLRRGPGKCSAMGRVSEHPPAEALTNVALLSASDRRTSLPGFGPNCNRSGGLRRHQHNPGPSNMMLRVHAMTDYTFQTLPVSKSVFEKGDFRGDTCMILGVWAFPNRGRHRYPDDAAVPI